MEDYYDPDKCFPVIKAYVLADRLVANTFRRDANAVANDLLGTRFFALSDFYMIASYAFEHIPPSRPILQHLVDRYCNLPRKPKDIEKLVKAEMELPTAFTRRVLHRYQEIVEAGKQPQNTPVNRYPAYANRCYRDHTNTEAQKYVLSHMELHMEWDEKTELGHFPGRSS